MIQIRKTRMEDMNRLMDIFEQGKRIMRKSGNLKQWTGGYPSRELVTKDIEAGHSYVCLNEKGDIIGTFTFIPGKDPTYARIYDGQWLDDEQPYATIHRLASTEDSHGGRLPGVVLHADTEPAGRHPPRQPHPATHPAKAWFPLLRHHLSDERRRTAGVPED